MILNETLVQKHLKGANNIEVLVKKLTPTKFYNQKDGLIVNVIRAFLNELKTQLGDLEDNMYRFVSIKDLNDYDILRLYHQSYLATLNLDKQEDFVVLNSSKLFSYINELIQYKGTAFLMVLLSNLLSTLIPSVRSSVKVLEDQLKDPNISSDDRKLIASKIRVFLDLYNKSSIIEVTEKDTFVYEVKGELDFISWYKFIKPFSHMLGWSVEFTNDTITIYKEDDINVYEMVVIDEMIEWKTHPFIKESKYHSASLNHYSHSFLLENTDPSYLVDDPVMGYVYNYKEINVGNDITNNHTMQVNTINRDDNYDEKIIRYTGDSYDPNKPNIKADHGSYLTSDKAHSSQDDAFLYKRVILRDKRIFNEIR